MTDHKFTQISCVISEAKRVTVQLVTKYGLSELKIITQFLSPGMIGLNIVEEIQKNKMTKTKNKRFCIDLLLSLNPRSSVRKQAYCSFVQVSKFQLHVILRTGPTIEHRAINAKNH